MKNNIGEFSLKDNISVSIDATLNEVIAQLMENNSGIVVFTKNNFPQGIITEREALKLTYEVDNLDLPLKKFFTPVKPITINKDRGCEYALHVLLDNSIRRLVVLNHDDTLYGIVTQDNLIDHLENSVYKTDMQISNFLHDQKAIITINENMMIDDAIKRMFDRNIGSVIITSNNKPVGIFTEKDGLKVKTNHNIENTPISTVMSSPLITINKDSFIEDAVSTMRSHDINRILINNKDGVPSHILSLRDITKSLQGNYEQLLESKLKTLKSSLDHIGEFIFEVYKDKGNYIIQWMNQKAIDTIGNHLDLPITSLIDEQVWELIHHNLQYSNIVNNYKVKIKNMHFEISCSNHYANERETLLFVLKDITNTVNELTHIKEVNTTLHDQIDMLKGVINIQKNIVFITDGFKIIHSNNAFLDFFNKKTLEDFNKEHICLSQKFLKHKEYYHPTSTTKNWIEEMLTIEESKRMITLIDVTTFEPKVFTVNIVKVENITNKYVISLEDISHSKFDNSKHYYNSTHDTMTQAYNRSFLHHNLQDEIDRAKRYNNIFSIIRFNIDNVTHINNKFGFIEGDNIIKKSIDIIINNIRATDMVARFDSDDFILLLPETPANKCELICENIKNNICEFDFRLETQITISFGITEFHIIDNITTILERSRRALSAAKERGKNQYVTH
jgi:diguanylate cyclase (GGDEF)-like protein